MATGTCALIIGVIALGAVVVAVLATKQLAMEAALRANKRELITLREGMHHSKLESEQPANNLPPLMQKESERVQSSLEKMDSFRGEPLAAAYDQFTNSTSVWPDKALLASIVDNRPAIEIFKENCYHRHNDCRIIYLARQSLHMMLTTIEEIEKGFPYITMMNNFEKLMSKMELVIPVPTQRLHSPLSVHSLLDMHAALVNETNIPTGFRNRTVQQASYPFPVTLPLPEDVPLLMDSFVKWINQESEDFFPRGNLSVLSKRAETKEEHDHIVIEKAIGWACDVHTRLLQIHPFSGANDPLARILSGIVLARFGLPLPKFLFQQLVQYPRALSKAIVVNNPTLLRRLYAKAVECSLLSMVESLNGRQTLTAGREQVYPKVTD